MHPMMGPMMMGKAMFRGFGRPMHMMLEDIESKEEAIEMLELLSKKADKRKEHLAQKIAKMDEVDKIIEETIGEIGQMKEFSKDEMRKILKKKYREFASKMLDD
jgi:hypothetical protein